MPLLGIFLIFSMAAAGFNQSIGASQSLGHFNTSCLHQEFGKGSVRLISKAFEVDVGLSKRGCYNSRQRNLSIIRASTSQTSLIDVVSSPSHNKSNDSRKKSGKQLYSFYFDSLGNSKYTHSNCLLLILQ